MKHACGGASFHGFLLLLFLFIAAIQTSDAVQCIEDNVLKSISLYKRYRECPTCAFIACYYGEYTGCPKYVLDSCGKNWPKEIASIRSKGENKLYYADKNIRYISGCDSHECLVERAEIIKDFYYSEGKRVGKHATADDPIWYYEKPGDAGPWHPEGKATKGKPVQKATTKKAVQGAVTGESADDELPSIPYYNDTMQYSNSSHSNAVVNKLTGIMVVIGLPFL